MIISALQHSACGALKRGGDFDRVSLLHSRQFPLYWPGNWKKTLIMNLRNILLKGSLGVFALALFASLQAQTITFDSDTWYTELTSCVVTFNGDIIFDVTDPTVLWPDGANSLSDFNVSTYGAGDYTVTMTDDYGDGGQGFFVDAGSLSCTGECSGTIAFCGIGNLCSETWSFSFIAGTPGCTDDTALNYDSEATQDDGSCYFDQCPGDSETMILFVMQDSYGDGWNGNTYEISADGSVIASGGLDAGSLGTDTLCMPFGACYTVNVAGGSWANEITWSITDAATGIVIQSDQGGGLVDFYYGDVADGVCGCTDESALNFDAAANVDDGSCVSSECAEGQTLVQFVMLDGCGVNWSGSIYTLTDGSGVQVASGGLASAQFTTTPGSSGYDFFCLSNTECYTLDVSGGIYSGCKEWQIIDYNTGDILYNQTNGDGFGTFGVAGPGVVCGCSDAAAYNYDADATVDDGSCFLPSCDHPDSTSYILRLTHDYYLNWGNNAAYIAVAGGDTILAAGFIDQVYAPDYEVTVVDGLYAFCVANDACLQLYAGGGATYGQALWEIMDFSGNVVHNGGLGVYDIGFGASEGNCVPGCTLTSAINFDPAATVNDGSCEVCDNGALGFYLTLQDDFANGWFGAQWYLTDEATGLAVDSGSMDPGLTTVEIVNCLNVGCYTFSTDAIFGSEGWSISDNLGNEYAPLTYGATDGWPISFPPVFPNTDPAEVNDCGFSGCTDPLGNNYNVSATVDDGSCIFPPANDTPETAQAIACGMSLSGSLENANGDEYNGTVILGNPISMSGAVWYEFNAESDYQASFNTCQSAYTNDGNGITDTDIVVFLENADGSLTAIATNDDSGVAGCGSDPSGIYNSLVSFNALQGQNYFLRVGTWADFTPQTGIVVEAECAVCPSGFPSNDDVCTLALPLVDGGSYDGSLCCSGPDEDFGLSSLSTFATAYGVWYEVETTADYNLYNITVEATGTGAIGYALYSGTDCTSLNDLAGGVVEGSVQDEMNQWFGGTTEGPATVGLTQPASDVNYYLFLWTTQTDECGSFTVTSSGEVSGCTDPTASNYDENATVDSGCLYTGVVQPNDSCSNAIAMACGETVSGNTGGATAAGGDNPCGTSGAGVWYTLDNASTEQLITISTCGSGSEALFEVFQEVDTPDATLEVNSLNQDNFQNISAVIVFNGDTVLTVPAGSLFPTVFNDYYYELSGGDYTVYFTNEGTELDGITANVISMDGSSSDLCSGGCSTDPSVCLDLQINSDAWAGETSYEMADADGNVVWSGGINSGSNSLSLCVPPGSYTFTMFDSYGDGICCTYGEGSYSLSGPDGVLASGGDFGSSESTSFTLDASPYNLPGGATFEQSFTIFGGTGTCNSLLCWNEGSNTAVSSESCDNGETFQFISDNNANTYAILVSAGGSSAFGGPFDMSVTCEPVVYGCMDALACNYNSAANVDDVNDPCDFTSCLECATEAWSWCYDNAESWSFTLNNSDGGGTIVIDLAGTLIEQNWDELTISDAATGASLYNSDEDADDSIVVGTDSVTVSFTSDGSISCATPSFFNPQPYAINMAITCATAPSVGCADTTACNYSGPVDFADNTLCDFSCLGCTDPDASNYNPFATIDDGTCCSGAVVEITMFDSFGDGWNGATYSFYNSADELLATGGLTTDNGGSVATDVLCFDVAECMTLIVTDGSWPTEISWSVSAGGQVIGSADAPSGTGTFSVGAECVEGCVLPFATNYIDADSVDIVNNDLCDFTGYVMGCTYGDATNYDETATNDDGSCEFDVANPCPTDLNGDNQTTTSDLLIFLGAFGTVCE